MSSRKPHLWLFWLNQHTNFVMFWIIELGEYIQKKMQQQQNKRKSYAAMIGISDDGGNVFLGLAITLSVGVGNQKIRISGEGMENYQKLISGGPAYSIAKSRCIFLTLQSLKIPGMKYPIKSNITFSLFFNNISV